MKLLPILALAFFIQDSGSMTGHTREISSLAISPNGKLIATGSVDLTVKVWDTSSKQCVSTLEGHDGDVQAMAFSPDGKLLASGEIYKKIKLWDVATKKETRMLIDMEGKVAGLVFSPDSKRIFAACMDNFVRVWSVGSPGDAKKLAHNWAVVGVAVSPDGKTLAAIDDGGNVTLWDATTLKKSKELKHSNAGKSIAYSADGKTIVTGGGELVKLWDAATGTEKASAKAEANTVAITANGSAVVVGTQDSLVLFLNGSDLSLIRKEEKHERPVTGVAVSPDGKTAYSASMDRVIRVWTIK